MSHHVEERVSPEDTSDLFLSIIMSHEEKLRETSITRHEMMADERDHTDTNVTKIQSSSEDLAYVPKDPSGSSEWTELIEWKDQNARQMIGTGKSTRNTRAARRLWLLA